MMNKIVLGLLALSLSFQACDNKNSPNTNGVIGISSDADLYLDNAKTNALLTLKTWVLVAYVNPEGQETNYSGYKRYSFSEKYISFNDNYPNDCNSCTAKAEYDRKAQIINVKKNGSTSCTEIACGNAAVSPQDAKNRVGNEFDLILEGNMGYKILKNNTLELTTSAGKYLFRNPVDFRDKKLADLNNSTWEIIAYRDIKNNPEDKLTPLKKSLLISFNSTGYGYSPDCNDCGYTLKDFSTKNNTISWDKKAEDFGTCTQKACLNQKTELPHSIVSNGMSYELLDNYLYLSDSKYKLKLRPYSIE